LVPSNILTIGNRCTLFSIIGNASFTSAVAQVVEYLEIFATKAIIKVEAEAQLIIDDFKSSKIGKRV